MELQLSGRYDSSRQDTWGTNSLPRVNTPDDPLPAFPMVTRTAPSRTMTAGFRYAPVADLTLRASVGTGFLSPSAAQTTPSITTTTLLTVTDPKRGGVSQTYNSVSWTLGSNPDLRPEQSRSVSAGLIYTPRFLPGFRLSVDYTKIDKTDEIASLSAQQTLDFEDLLPAGQVTRAALTSADQALGYTGGVVTAYRTNSVNFARKIVEAIDVQADYTRKTSLGEFRAYGMATINRRNATQVVPTAPLIDTVGYTTSTVHANFKWRGNVGLDWRRGPWSAGWNIQYYGSLYVYGANDTAATRASTILTQGSDHYPSQYFCDVRASYQLGKQGEGWRRAFGDMKLSVGVQNAFNRDLLIRAGTSASLGYLPVDDPRLRRYSLNLEKRF